MTRGNVYAVFPFSSTEAAQKMVDDSIYFGRVVTDKECRELGPAYLAAIERDETEPESDER